MGGHVTRGGWTFTRECKPILARLWAKTVETPTGCWEWCGHVKPNGYGTIQIGRRNDGTRRRVHVHRVGYEELVGPIPDGHTIDHLCRNRRCWNPAHLEPVVMAENLRRGDGWSGQNARKTHCPAGHLYTPENTIDCKPGRKCRACKQANDRARYRRRIASGTG